LQKQCHEEQNGAGAAAIFSPQTIVYYAA